MHGVINPGLELFQGQAIALPFDDGDGIAVIPEGLLADEFVLWLLEHSGVLVESSKKLVSSGD